MFYFQIILHITKFIVFTMLGVRCYKFLEIIDQGHRLKYFCQEAVGKSHFLSVFYLKLGLEENSVA